MTTAEIVYRAEKLLARTANHDHVQGIGINEQNEVYIITEMPDAAAASSILIKTAAGYVPIVVKSRMIRDPDPWSPVK